MGVTKSFIEQEDLAFSSQLNKFAKILPSYATLLGISAGETDGAKADALFFAYILTWMGIYRDFGVSTTAYKNLARHGDGADALTAVPATPVADVPPALVGADIEKRFSDLVARIKKSANYTNAIGQALGIVAPDSPFVPGDGQPELVITLVEGGFPQIKYTMGEYEGIQLLKDAGAGFSLLNVVNHPTYVDKSGMPAPGQTAIFNYKAIYLYKGGIVGKYSAVVSVTVTG